MEIEFLDSSESYFLKKWATGINVIAGAGFSILPSPSGKKLFLGEELRKNLLSHFEVTDCDDFSLEELCQILYTRFGEMLVKNYIASLFTVKDFNPLYFNLLRGPLCSFTTTNIDNIFNLVVAQDKRFYLRDIASLGKSVPSLTEIPFLPLHGSVLFNVTSLKSSKNEISINDSNNQYYFSAFQHIIETNPILVLGYSFNDADVFSALISSVHDFSRFWILVKPDDQKNKKYFSSMGCHIITGDTESFLNYLGRQVLPSDLDNQTHLDVFSKYRVPAQKNIININDYRARCW